MRKNHGQRTILLNGLTQTIKSITFEPWTPPKYFFFTSPIFIKSVIKNVIAQNVILPE